MLSVQSLTPLLKGSIYTISKTLPKSSTSCGSVFYIHISSVLFFFFLNSLLFFLGHKESPVIFLPPKYCRLVLLQNIKPETPGRMTLKRALFVVTGLLNSYGHPVCAMGNPRLADPYCPASCHTQRAQFPLTLGKIHSLLQPTFQRNSRN